MDPEKIFVRSAIGIDVGKDLCVACSLPETKFFTFRNESKAIQKGSSDKCVPCLMDIEDFQAEVRWVAEAVGSTFEGFDFVVHTFERTSRNRVCVPGKEAVQAGAERSAKCRKC